MSKQLAEILNRLKSHLREIYGDRLVNMILFTNQ